MASVLADSCSNVSSDYEDARKLSQAMQTYMNEFVNISTL
jgi:hypothetical protein